LRELFSFEAGFAMRHGPQRSVIRTRAREKMQANTIGSVIVGVLALTACSSESSTTSRGNAGGPPSAPTSNSVINSGNMVAVASRDVAAKPSPAAAATVDAKGSSAAIVSEAPTYPGARDVKDFVQSTKDSPEAVIDFYQKALSASGGTVKRIDRHRAVTLYVGDSADVAELMVVITNPPSGEVGITRYSRQRT